MTLRVDPEIIGRLAAGLDGSTSKLSGAAPPPEADAGPSAPAVTATLAELMRAAAGLAEMTSTTAEDLRINKTTYAGTEEANQGMFGQIKPR